MIPLSVIIQTHAVSSCAEAAANSKLFRFGFLRLCHLSDCLPVPYKPPECDCPQDCECRGYARPAWDRVRGLGAEEKEALPCDFAESTSQDFHVKGIQRTLSHLEHGRRYRQLYQAASPEVSAAMHSLSSPHAMIWHRVCPFEPRLQIASYLVKMRVRQELDLRMPCLTDAYNHQRAARCCNPHHAAAQAAQRFRPPALCDHRQRRWQRQKDPRQAEVRRASRLQSRGTLNF
jgi:hypothetical protein|mmetsp:Transcript_6778/g.18419  ORF Transcript_6778/g.18419 Transcript_6778/m.18419 type:complete len:232 (-) Transcript_6778:2412-3107(-)